jgi:hypothetical protein
MIIEDCSYSNFVDTPEVDTIVSKSLVCVCVCVCNTIVTSNKVVSQTEACSLRIVYWKENIFCLL